jgi:hypothetical protein
MKIKSIYWESGMDNEVTFKVLEVKSWKVSDMLEEWNKVVGDDDEEWNWKEYHSFFTVVKKTADCVAVEGGEGEERWIFVKA